MTDDQKEELEVLVKNYQDKSEVFKIHQMLNTAGKSFKELNAMGLAYNIAEIEMQEAYFELQKFKAGF